MGECIHKFADVYVCIGDSACAWIRMRRRKQRTRRRGKRRKKIGGGEEIAKGKGGMEERPKLPVTSKRLKDLSSSNWTSLSPHPFCCMRLQTFCQPKILK